MPRIRNLIAPLAGIAALLAAGTAHAEARRSAQSIPVATRFTPPALAKATRQEPGRAEGRDDRNRFDNRRYKYDRDDFERRKEREGHKFRHHDRDDSPGC